MVRIAILGLISVAMATTVTMEKAQNSAHNVVVDADDSVQRYYGIPLDLTLKQLAKLPFKSKVTLEHGDEDLSSPVAIISARRGVKIRAEFDDDGKLYRFETSTPGAMGLRGLRIGSTLAELQRAFPQRKPYWGATPHDQYYATFGTGTPLTFHFSPFDVPKETWASGPERFQLPPSIKVKKITITPINWR